MIGACSRAQPVIEADAAPPLAPPPLAAAETVDAGLPPLRGEWLEKLEGNAFVAPPLGATEKRPVIVAVHGASNHPGLMCAAWRAIADGYAFVVCPGGRPTGTDAYYVWSSAEHISQAIDAALASARARYGAWMLDAPYVYAGFSQGATLAAPVLVNGKFARAALTEGGYHAFEDGFAHAFVKSGGERVLYTCSQAGCLGSFGGSKSALAHAHALVEVHSPGPVGHSLTPQVRASINADLGWLVDGMIGWESYASAPKLPTH
jgi:predicted esterase